MVQGGDPMGTGKGGESIWGGKFDDEFHPQNRVRFCIYDIALHSIAHVPHLTYV